MRSRRGGWRIALLVGAWAAAAHSAPAAVERSFTAVDSAVAALERDPNLGGESKVRTLKWTNTSPQPTRATDTPPWIIGLFDYLGQISGLVLWAAGVVAVAVAAIWIFRHVGGQKRTQAPDMTPAASRVLDLDIRPNSLPDDVPAAAMALSSDGRPREALSLLYRASLSRAVNLLGVAIGPSLTEREALGVVRALLDESRARYFADLVLMWQRVVYAGEAVAHGEVVPLCTRFADTLDALPP
ncbi:MAG TPA: hypothetical protein VGO37_07045 [Steroidobacteraceae bacterium]|jgi:hypothetical protein|nr:hypothetical protein [Steroidobacteraceae bacterium]